MKNYEFIENNKVRITEDVTVTREDVIDLSILSNDIDVLQKRIDELQNELDIKKAQLSDINKKRP